MAALVVAVALSAACGPAAHAAPPAAAPSAGREELPESSGAVAPPAWWPPAWAIGAPTGLGAVQSLEVHREFVRVRATQGAFEIATCDADGDRSWCAGPLRLQPAPGAALDDAAASALLQTLQAHLEAHPLAAGQAWVQVQRRPPKVAIDRGGVTIQAAVAPEMPWLAWLAVTWLLACAVAWRLAADRALRRLAGTLCGAGVAIAGVGRIDGVAEALGGGPFNLLHEAWASSDVDLLTSVWRDDEPARWLWGPGAGAAGRIAASRILGGLAIGLLGLGLAQLATHRWYAVAIVALCSLAPQALRAANAEVEATRAWMALTMAGLGVAAAWRPDLHVRWRVAGLVLAAAQWVWLDRRREVAILCGILAIIAALGAFIRLPTLRLAERATTWLRPAAVRPWVWWLLAAMVGLHALRPPVPGTLHETALWGVNPLAPEGLRLPLDLAMGAPLLLVAAWCLGAWRAIAGPIPWLRLVLLAQLTLHAVYGHVGHGDFYEVQRYMASLLPMTAVISLYGAESVADVIFASATTPVRRAIAAAGVIYAALFHGSAGLDQTGSRRGYAERALLDCNQQRHARFLLRSVHDYPGCIHVARTAVSVDGLGKVSESAIVLFGGGLPGPIRCGPSRQDLARALASLPRPPACLRATSSADCLLAGMPDCAELGEPAEGRPNIQPSRECRADHFGLASSSHMHMWSAPLARSWWPLPPGAP